MILNILLTNRWERPIYFALAGNPVDRIGLDDYLQMQGMALEVVPVRRDPTDRYNMNLPLVEKNLLTENVVASKDYQPGFLFRNLNHPDLNVEEQAQDMIDTYRAIYNMAARQYVVADPPKAKKYISTMKQRIPHEVMPMNFNLLLDVLDMTNQMNDKENFEYFSGIVIKEANKQLALNPENTEMLNVLAWIYERNLEYSKALDIYKKFLALTPNDQNLLGRIAYIESLLKDSTKK